MWVRCTRGRLLVCWADERVLLVHQQRQVLPNLPPPLVMVGQMSRAPVIADLCRTMNYSYIDRA
eukprot:131511-Pleurochrysis_carterae.AAC.3